MVNISSAKIILFDNRISTINVFSAGFGLFGIIRIFINGCKPQLRGSPIVTLCVKYMLYMYIYNIYRNNIYL